MPEMAWVVPTVKATARDLLSLATRTDQASDVRAFTCMIDAAGRLSKCAGLAGNDRTPQAGPSTKRAAVLALANLSFRAYFKLNNIRLCETVLGSVQNALLMNRRNQDGAESGEECYPIAERVTYRFYLGQLRLIQHSVHAAAEHLRWAFDHCTRRHRHNQRKILISLIAAYLILGRYPSRALLTRFDLEERFGALLQHHRLGGGAGVERDLRAHRDWLRSRGLYLILNEKLVLGVWRNLLRRCLRISRALIPQSSAPPTLQIASLVAPARVAWDDASISADDIECVAANLIDQVRRCTAPRLILTGTDEGLHPALEGDHRAAERATPRVSPARLCIQRVMPKCGGWFTGGWFCAMRRHIGVNVLQWAGGVAVLH